MEDALYQGTVQHSRRRKEMASMEVRMPKGSTGGVKIKLNAYA